MRDGHRTRTIEPNSRRRGRAGRRRGAAPGFSCSRMTPPPPRAVVTNPARRDESRGQRAGRGQSAGCVQGRAAAPARAAATTAAKPAAQAARSRSRPIRTSSIAEVIETSGLTTYFQTLRARGDATPSQRTSLGAAAERRTRPTLRSAMVSARSSRESITAEASGEAEGRTSTPSAWRVSSRSCASRSRSRWLAAERRQRPARGVKEYAEAQRKDPPPAARAKLIQALDDVTQSFASRGRAWSPTWRARWSTRCWRELNKAGKKVPQEARQSVAAQENAIRGQARAQIRRSCYVIYRDASDEELAEYVKLLDTDTGRWGMELLAEATPCARSLGEPRRDARQAISRTSRWPSHGHGGQGARRRRPAVAKARPKRRRASRPRRPAAPRRRSPSATGGRRTSARSTRYNDVISATVMRDRRGGQGAARRRQVAERAPDRRPDAAHDRGRQWRRRHRHPAAGERARTRTCTRPAARRALSIAKARGTAGAGMVQLLQRERREGVGRFAFTPCASVRHAPSAALRSARWRAAGGRRAADLRRAPALQPRRLGDACRRRRRSRSCARPA